jgi:hypothetical protein
MKSLMLLWQQVAIDYGNQCCISTTLDYNTVERRVKDEGLSFLTITLPAYGKDFERALSTEQVDSTMFTSFRKRGGLPLFLGGFLGLIFDRKNGSLLHEPSLEAIRAVRQLTLLHGKILLPCSSKRTHMAFESYMKIEQEIRVRDRAGEDLLDFARIGNVLFGDVLAKMDSLIYRGNIVPRHGPGATADHIRGNAKYDQRTWPSRLEAVFPFGEYALPSFRFSYLLEHVDFLDPGDEVPARVIPVPKTLKTPRIIAAEPVATQYAQQAMMLELVPLLEKSNIGPMIGFHDQEPNQLMAKSGSLTGALATLDLSEASDRVSNQHVRALLRRGPFFELVDASRSRKADVPGFGVVRLAKFASMGSGLCFPLEAMVFLTVIFMAIEKARGNGYRLRRKDLPSFYGVVRVYGDDLIVPVEFAARVMEELDTFGYRVNSSKSFWSGSFRESCGKEYFRGEDVTVARCRNVFPESRADAQEVISLVSLRNQFYELGNWEVSRWLDEKIVSLIRHFPIVEPSSPVVGRRSIFGYENTRSCDKLHRPLVRGYVEQSKPPKSKLSGEGALLKCLLKQSVEPFADVNHLERQGRPKSVYIKLRWATPY